jgi:hemerythrin
MKRIRFPGLLEHMVEHRKFSIQIQDLRSRYDTETPEVSLETSMLLFAWFKDHILVQDMAFAAYARRTDALMK